MKNVSKLTLFLFTVVACVATAFLFKTYRQTANRQVAVLEEKLKSQSADGQAAATASAQPKPAQATTRASSEAENEEAEEGEEILDAFKDIEFKTMDLSLGYAPSDRIWEAYEKTRDLQRAVYGGNVLGEARGDITRIKWKSRGPMNIGGRTRSILVDAADPTNKTVFAGSVSGGIWKTTDISAAKPVWVKINDFLDNLSIGALAQDPVDPSIIYAGTGEGYPNADAYRGIGVLKSVDGGNTWSLLANSRNFGATLRLIVHPVTRDVYAGTQNGLYKSKDQGATWTQVQSGTIYGLEYAPNGYLYASKSSSISRSQSGDNGMWTSVTGPVSGFPSTWGRTEFSICKSQPNIIYAVGNLSSAGSNVYRTDDDGKTWVKKSVPMNGASNFASNQAWYDLTIAVDPNNPNHVMTGGVVVMRSFDGANTFTNITSGMHVDQHVTTFYGNSSDTVYFGNDGGVWRSVNASSSSIRIENKNNGYITTQFYACAIHPDAYSNYFLGGTQDNNSLQLNDADIAQARVVRGGDGMYCHVDQTDPRYQVVCSQNTNYSISRDGGATWTGTFNMFGDWAGPSDIDDSTHLFYSQSDSCDFFRWNLVSGSPVRVFVSGVTKPVVTALRVDPNTPNRVYLGCTQGRIIRVDSAHNGTTVSAVELTTLTGRGTVSCVEIEQGNPNHLLVTVSNYGQANNIFESKDGGKTWTGVEGTALTGADRFPDIPIWWALFNPNDGNQALIATEAGVWSTTLLDGANTRWLPPVPGLGIPLTRVSMLLTRKSDKLVLAGTYGRGLWTSEVFAEASIGALRFDRVLYTKVQVPFSAQTANADSWLWNFGDGTTDSIERPLKSYANVGTYPVSLKINGTISSSAEVKVLPDLPLPYTAQGSGAYGGAFETNPEQYGVYTVSGSSFERGRSTVTGKNGTRSGSNAFVVGLNEQSYQPNTHTMLYLPNFDMSEQGIYEFSFFAKYQMQSGADGFKVEYSTDKGLTWNQLGAQANGWYNFTNTNTSTFSFGIGEAYFTGTVSNFTQYTLNVSNLAGNKNVAFRFVFKSDNAGLHPGLAIDDVEIVKYTGELITKIVSQSAAFSNFNEITFNWSTLPEFNCQRFEVELSENARDFTKILTASATGVTSIRPQTYLQRYVANKCIYYYRIKVINENTTTGYALTFYTPVTIIKREEGCGQGVYTVFPNPFRDYVDLSFADAISGEIKLELFDDAGRLVASRKQAVDKTYYLRFDTGALSKANYYLRVTLPGNDPVTYKLFGGVE